jgi:hypothetical protein
MKFFSLAILILVLYTLNYSFSDQNTETTQIINLNNDKANLNNINFTYGQAPLIKVVNLTIIKDLSEIVDINLIEKETKNIPLLLPFKKQDRTYEQINYDQMKIETNQYSSSDLKTLSSFEGIHYGFNGFNPNFWTPPDVQIAVSNDYVVEFVNVLGAVWTKSGSFVSYINLYSLFSGNKIGDPRIIYDNLSNRFFASVFDKDYNATRIAVSATSNPLGSWYVYRIDQPNGYFPDQAYLGVDNDKVVISANLYIIYSSQNYEYKGAQYWVLNKQQMLSGSSVNYAVSNIDNTVFSIRPAIHLSSTNTFYMATTIYSNTIRVYTIIGTPPSSVNVNAYDFSVKTINFPPPAPQLGSSNQLATVDTRIQDIIWKNGRLIFTANVGCIPSGDSITRSCLRIIEIDTNNLQLKQDFNYGKAGKYLFFGSLRLNKDDILFIVFGYSSSNDYPGIMASYQITPNSLEEPIIIKTGTGPETVYCPNNICRYGDYFGSSTDPAEPEYIWIAGEFGRGSAGWSTYIAKLGLTTYFIVASYSIIGNETGSSPPVLKYYYNNILYSVTLTKNPTKYIVDKNSPWEVTETLQGSDSNERWKTEQVTSGTVTSPLTLSLIYYHQYYVQFKYTILNGGEGYSAPLITILQFGKTITVEPNASLWVDENEYNATNPLVGSNENERWYSLNNQGKINKAGIYEIVYYHQYNLQFNFRIIGKWNNNAPEVTYVQFGKEINAKLNATVWIDANTEYNITNPLTGSNNNERWYSQNSTTGIADKWKKVLVIYYHQYFVNFTYQVIGSGGYGEPFISFVQFGKNVTTKPNNAVWIDSNTEYIYQNPLPNSNENERWYSQNYKEKVTKPGEILVIYYHQYYVQFKYTILNGGEGYSAPLITILQFGKTITVEPNASLWVDENEYNATNPLVGSNENERWYSLNNQGKINKAGIYEIVYYHQYLIKIKYSVTGKELPKNPIINGTSLGEKVSKEINKEDTQIWLDANSEFNVSYIIQENPKERWITEQFNYIVSKPESIVVVYSHQYYVSITSNSPKAGIVNPSSGWYNEGSTLVLSALPNNDWKFYKWIGTGSSAYTGTMNNVTIIVNSPIEQTAIFLASLKIYSTNGGSVIYTYGNETGKVESNSMKEIFVLPGEEVTLTAEPSSMFYVLKYWTGDLKESKIKITVNEPSQITATFDLNWLLIIIISLSIIISILIVILVKKIKK